LGTFGNRLEIAWGRLGTFGNEWESLEFIWELLGQMGGIPGLRRGFQLLHIEHLALNIASFIFYFSLTSQASGLTPSFYICQRLSTILSVSRAMRITNNLFGFCPKCLPRNDLKSFPSRVSCFVTRHFSRRGGGEERWPSDAQGHDLHRRHRLPPQSRPLLYELNYPTSKSYVAVFYPK
jgi:hypothetical protein